MPHQVLLNNLCDKPIVYFSDEGTLAVLPGCDGIIVRPQYIQAVLLEWRVWWKAGLEIWYASLQTILALISESHPHSSFNIQQCQHADVLNLLINACRVRPYLRLFLLWTLVCAEKCEIGKIVPLGTTGSCCCPHSVCLFVILQVLQCNIGIDKKGFIHALSMKWSVFFLSVAMPQQCSVCLVAEISVESCYVLQVPLFFYLNFVYCTCGWQLCSDSCPPGLPSRG